MEETNGNGKGPVDSEAPETPPPAASSVPSEGAADAAAADPAMTGDGWEEMRRTAEEALQRPSARTAPVDTRTTTWLVLTLVVASVLMVGVWFIWFNARQAVEGQRQRMQFLQDKANAYQSMVDYTRIEGHMPDGVPTPALTDAEAKELSDLQRKFGVAPPAPPASRPAP